MENAFRLHPWDIRRLTFGEFRRRAEYLIELAEARKDREG